MCGVAFGLLNDFHVAEDIADDVHEGGVEFVCNHRGRDNNDFEALVIGRDNCDLLNRLGVVQVSGTHDVRRLDSQVRFALVVCEVERRQAGNQASDRGAPFVRTAFSEMGGLYMQVLRGKELDKRFMLLLE